MKMTKSLQIVSSFFLTLFLFLPASLLYAQSVALMPVDRKDDWWVKRHADNVAQMEKGDVNLLMIGDSITHAWDTKDRGKTVWESYYGHRKPINLGFNGDQTQHVLWRLEHLPLDKISPKAAVLMIGTNNIGRHNSSSPKDAADGIKAIVEKLEKQYPALKIIVLNVFPRGNKVDDGNRKKVDEINSYLPELLKDKPNVTLLNINNIFLDTEKNLPKEIMPDFLHPNTYGYELWAKAVEPTLTALLSETNPAIVPVDKMSEEWWNKRHEANAEKIAKGNVEFLMIGDSITHGWDRQGALVEKYFAQYKPVNLGFGGDQTQHVLWRLDHLPLDKISPKVAMIMIGTNNTDNPANTPWMIAVGIKTIVEKLQKQKPDLQIIVLKIFPRADKEKLHLRVNEVNLVLPELLAGLNNVEIIDINKEFLAEDGTLPKEMMPDFLHPNTKGYEIWGEKLAPVLKTKFGR
jgi:lysophospholipase L1-like esterase